MTHRTAIEIYLDDLAIVYQSIQFFRHHDHTGPNSVYSEPFVPWDKVYKTLALTGKRSGPIIAIVPVGARLCYKKLARVSGNRSVGMIPVERLVETTGYEHGTNNPIGIFKAKAYPIFIDEKACHQTKICVSAGEPNRATLLDSLTLADVVHAQFADLIDVS